MISYLVDAVLLIALAFTSLRVTRMHRELARLRNDDLVPVLAHPERHGATVAGGLLSGAGRDYAIYSLRDGWVACAALEPHFSARLTEVAGEDVAGFLAAVWRLDLAGIPAAIRGIRRPA